MYRKRRYRLFRPRYDWTMIRDQVGETAYGNAVSSGKYLSGLLYAGVCAYREPSVLLIFTHDGLILFACSTWKSKLKILELTSKMKKLNTRTTKLS